MHTHNDNKGVTKVSPYGFAVTFVVRPQNGLEILQEPCRINTNPTSFLSQCSLILLGEKVEKGSLSGNKDLFKNEVNKIEPPMF